ncbi:hypothetical protein BD410DRAFT_839886 [Rickenella mellea]|uniref:Uncharacterized protein n=1 Tax=Rickenella mellea TaxID=50990 RepID=A0A4Y7Q4Z5_9AGAM|nr:hypothetical protein BD410DRAFT_839886 [Rickenella mellea]
MHLDYMERTRVPNDECFPITGLENLISLLGRLKTHEFQESNVGETSDHEVPGLAIRSISSKNTRHGSDLSDLRRSLDEAKLCMAAMNEFRDRLERRIRFLRKECIPLILQDGIKNLPDELLSHIFEAGHGMTVGWTFTKAVSQVSRRFRQVSLRTPLLWTRIFAYYTADQIEGFLSLSGRMDLDISTQPYGSERLAYLRRFLPHLNRWTTLRHLDEATARLMRDIGFTDLPRLEALHHHCTNDPISWSLFRVNGYNIFPDPICYSRLTSFEFAVNGHGRIFDTESFAQAVYSMKSLRQLSLTINDCTSANIKVETTHDLHSVPIDALHVAVKGRTSYALVDSFYVSLSFLSASTVHFTLVDVRYAPDEDNTPLEFYYASESELMFPYGSVINVTTLGIEERFDPNVHPGLLVWLVEDCKIAHTINFDTTRGVIYMSFRRRI